jgi:hypothetical protein
MITGAYAIIFCDTCTTSKEIELDTACTEQGISAFRDLEKVKQLLAAYEWTILDTDQHQCGICRYEAETRDCE